MSNERIYSEFCSKMLFLKFILSSCPLALPYAQTPVGSSGSGDGGSTSGDGNGMAAASASACGIQRQFLQVLSLRNIQSFGLMFSISYQLFRNNRHNFKRLQVPRYGHADTRLEDHWIFDRTVRRECCSGINLEV